jgi:hypothetical protein
MFPHPSSPQAKYWIAALAVAAASAGKTIAQDFTMMVTDPNPLGLGAFVPGVLDLVPGMEGGFKGDLSYGIEVESEYNTNFFLTGNDEESEFSTFFNPWIRYITDPEGGAKFSLAANYSPNYRSYLDNSDLNGFDQSGDITFSYRGSRTDIDLFGRYSQISGTDRLTGDFIEGSIFTAGIRANREIASRTRVNAGWSFAKSEYGSSGNEGANVNTIYLGGLWDKSPRTSFGSTVRYTRSESDNSGTRDAWAMLVEARYRVGERLWFSASIGPEYARNSDDGDDESSFNLTGDLTARYQIDERWTWVSSVRSATVPSPSETNYLVNNLAVSTSLNRRLLRGWVGFGLQYNYSEYNDVGDVTDDVSDEHYTSLFIDYQRPILNDRAQIDAGLRYTFNEGSVDWSQWIASLGFRVSF